MRIRNISASDARNDSLAGAVKVCAYENTEMFKTNHLLGAISFQSFKELAPSLPKDREIIFYCD